MQLRIFCNLVAVVAVFQKSATTAATSATKIIMKGGKQNGKQSTNHPLAQKAARPGVPDFPIDFERCLYRDFGNGFNVEISGVNSRKKDQKATLYLWYGEKAPNCLIVKRVHDVERTAEAIASEVNCLKDYSNGLVLHGYNNWDAIFYMLHP